LSKRDEAKVRAVWIYPFEMVMLEAPFSLALSERMQKDEDGLILFGPR